MSLRKLKYHEAKLLKKVDFLNWKQDSNLREVKVLRRYHVQDREDYHEYNKACGMITKVNMPHSSNPGFTATFPPLPTPPTTSSSLGCVAGSL